MDLPSTWWFSIAILPCIAIYCHLLIAIYCHLLPSIAIYCLMLQDVKGIFGCPYSDKLPIPFTWQTELFEACEKWKVWKLWSHHVPSGGVQQWIHNLMGGFDYSVFPHPTCDDFCLIWLYLAFILDHITVGWTSFQPFGSWTAWVEEANKMVLKVLTKATWGTWGTCAQWGISISASFCRQNANWTLPKISGQAAMDVSWFHLGWRVRIDCHLAISWLQLPQLGGFLLGPSRGVHSTHPTARCRTICSAWMIWIWTTWNLSGAIVIRCFCCTLAAGPRVGALKLIQISLII